MKLNDLSLKLSELFDFHRKELKNRKQSEIVSRGLVFSEIDPQAELLICGFNPSLRTDFLKTEKSYDYNLVKNFDRYFKKFEPLILSTEFGLKVSYFDLFYQKHSKQKEIDCFYQDEKGLSFLQAQLSLTKQLIVEIKPKVILVFNKQAIPFFEFHPKHKIGMGFNLIKKSKVNSFYCAELECFIYPSRFLNHFVKQQELATIKIEIHQLLRKLMKDK